jgi:hypothetical protein
MCSLLSCIKGAQFVFAPTLLKYLIDSELNSANEAIALGVIGPWLVEAETDSGSMPCRFPSQLVREAASTLFLAAFI